MLPATHIIGKQNIRVRYRGATDVLALQQTISRICQEELPARLQALFDRYDDKDSLLQLGKLELSVTLASAGDIQEQLAKAIVEKAEALIRQALEQQLAATVSMDKSVAHMLRFYLVRGYLPWWALEKEAAPFKILLQQHWQLPALSHITAAIRPVLDDAGARARFLSLLDDTAFTAFITATGFISDEEWQAWQQAFNRMGNMVAPGAFTALARQALLASFAAAHSAADVAPKLAVALWTALSGQGILLTPEQLRSIRSKTVREALAKAGRQTAANHRQTVQLLQNPVMPAGHAAPKAPGAPEPGATILVRNAGLVLLAPFLPALYERLDVLAGEELKDTPRAILLLRYLAYGHTAFEEFEIVLEKILCGLSLSISIEPHKQLLPEEMQEAEHLLQSVVAHWAVLKNTSPEGLRCNFLQREGRLVFTGVQWELQVQKQAHDILLDYLPWSMSLIKLPWMPQLLAVKWGA